MKSFRRLLPIAIGLLISTGLMACTNLQMDSQPTPSEPVSPTLSEDGTAPSPDAIASASWATILGATSAPEGWRVTPCENPNLLCVYEGDNLIGTVELFTQPVVGSAFEAMLTASEGEPTEALRAWTEELYASIERDRQIGDSTVQFSADPPEPVMVGNLPGLRYSYTTTHATGALVDRAIGYAATDGTTLYAIVTGVISGDPSGSFSSDEAVQQFTPHLAEIVENLRL